MDSAKDILALLFGASGLLGYLRAQVSDLSARLDRVDARLRRLENRNEKNE